MYVEPTEPLLVYAKDAVDRLFVENARLASPSAEGTTPKHPSGETIRLLRALLK